MARRSFTLLELLIATGLVLALAGLALPSLWSRMDEARTDMATRLVGAAIVAARSEAQRDGEPVELVVAGSREGQALAIRPVQGAEQGHSQGVQPWGVLPPGVRLSMQAPADSQEALVVAPAAPVSTPERIGIFIPDGSVSTSGPAYLSVGGQTYIVTLNRWSGGASLSLYAADEQPAEGEPPPPDVGEEEPP